MLMFNLDPKTNNVKYKWMAFKQFSKTCMSKDNVYEGPFTSKYSCYTVSEVL